MDINDLTLAQASQLLHTGKTNPLGLNNLYVERIARLNPTLGAFINFDAQAASSAGSMANHMWIHRVDNGPLHGIPIAIKDLFDTAGEPTTGGSRIFRDRIPAEDATVVGRLRKAGAVLIGKTNMHEWAYGVTNDNPHFGRAVNPWDSSR